MNIDPNLPLPAGVIAADDWPLEHNGVPGRTLLWFELDEVEISGFQYADGHIDAPGIAVYLPVDRHLGVAEARDLAAKLSKAADALAAL